MSLKNLLVISPHLARSNETRTKQTKLLIEGLVELFDDNIRIEIYHYETSHTQDLELWANALGKAVRLKSLDGLRLFEQTRYLWRINRFVKDNFKSLWSRRVSKDIIQRLNNGNLNCDETILLTVSTPIEAHFTGLSITARVSKVSWYALFSDVWPADILPIPYYQRNILRRWRLKLLSQILEQSDKVIVTNNKARLAFEAINGQNVCDDFSVLNHFSELKNGSKKSDSGFLLHLGSLDCYRACEHNVNLLNYLVNNLNLTLMQVGSTDYSVKEQLSQSLNQNVVFKSYTEDVAPLIASSRYVVIIEANMDSVFIPSKVADCICSGKEIIALTKSDSPTAELLRKFAAGFLVYLNEDSNVELEKLPNSHTDAESYRSYVRNQLQHVFQ